MNVDFGVIGAAIVSAIVGGAGYLIGRPRRDASIAEDIAQSRAGTYVADAEGSLYRRLKDELDSMQAAIVRERIEREATNRLVAMLRVDLEVAQAHARRQEAFIWQLIKLLREHDIEPPPFEVAPTQQMEPAR